MFALFRLNSFLFSSWFTSITIQPIAASRLLQLRSSSASIRVSSQICVSNISYNFLSNGLCGLWSLLLPCHHAGFLCRLRCYSFKIFRFATVAPCLWALRFVSVGTIFFLIAVKYKCFIQFSDTRKKNRFFSKYILKCHKNFREVQGCINQCAINEIDLNGTSKMRIDCQYTD